MIRIIAIIPTAGRPQSLPRALESILHQSLKPTKIIIVGENQEDINTFSAGSIPEPVTLVNRRTPNLSGAINTALFYLVSTETVAKETYIAFLDDDDLWENKYLEKCVSSARANDSDMVVSGIIRHETESDSGRKQSIPSYLSSSSFLTTNPHIQGSNLFVRLSSLLKAGAFDENLDSTTDRDVCIRLFDLGNLKVSYVNEHLVHHYATGSRRISSFGSDRKKQGLGEFFRKYASRMSLEEQIQFKKRAFELFGCAESDFLNRAENETEDGPKKDYSSLNSNLPVDLIVGFTSSNIESTKLLLEDLSQIFEVFSGKKKLVFCDNTEDPTELEQISRILSSKLEVKIIGKELVDKDATAGNFGKYYQQISRRKGIAFGRTVLHHYLYLESLELSNPVVWILDDDIRLDKISLNDMELQPEEFSQYVSSVRSDGRSIAVGKISGDAPLPSASMVRTELLDFLFNLRALTNPSNNQLAIQEQKRDNETIAKKYPDYYYDLTLRHSQHLEVPIWFGSDPNITRIHKLSSMLENFPSVLSGVNPFRPIVSSIDQEMTETGIPVRGGNALVFDMECLRTFPNIAPITDGIHFRRGDTIWALMNQEIGGRKVSSRRKKVISVPLFVRQDRSNSVRSNLSLQTAFDDIYGASLVRALKEHLSNKKEKIGPDASAHELLHFSDDEINLILSDFESKVKFRFDMMQMNSWRIRGLVDSIRKLMEEIKSSHAKEGEVLQNYSSIVDGVLVKIENEFSLSNVVKCMGSLERAKNELRGFLENLETYCVSYREKLPVHASKEEIEDARRFVEEEFNVTQIALLGEGSEGLVFSNGVKAYKYFHHGTRHFEQGRLELIQRLLSSKSLPKHVLGIENIRVKQDRVVFVSPLVQGELYHGGCLSSILELMRECRTAGICLTNICPENLLVNNSQVKYIDVGTSIVEFSENYFDQMCKRAYLMYRWHFRKDLKSILTRSLKDNNLPELFGFKYFMTAVEVKDTHELVDPILIPLLEISNASEILDFGCGSGRVADQIAKLGKSVTAFDIDNRDFLSHSPHEKGVSFVDSIQLDELVAKGKKFDRIICNLVICTIEDDKEATDVLVKCKKLLSPDGFLIVGVCNPFGISTIESTSHVKQLSSNVSYKGKFLYRKQAKTTGHWRPDVHRPFSWYESVFRKVGLQIDKVEEIPSVDVPLLSPSSDFILFRLHSMRMQQSNVSLLIKAGCMEWRTIRNQIEHIVKQLEGPQRFLEKIVVTDSYEGPFVRQYDSGNWDKFHAELDSLVDDKVIDRYYVAPSDGKSISELSLKWFGLEASSLRSKNGQPALTILHGFEMCKSDYIFHLDSDCLIGRKDRNHDYLEEMLDVFREDDSAVTVSLPIAGDEKKHFVTNEENRKWRTEQRCGMISKSRIAKLLPLPNSLDAGVLTHAWHRSLDFALNNGNMQSYRGGDPKTFFIHVSNDRKKDSNGWYNIMKSVESGRLIPEQIGKVELVGLVEDWLEPRKEHLIFVLRGRNYPISKIRRCVDSLMAQGNQDWGAVLIDAASDNGSEQFLETIVCQRFGSRVTIYRNLSPLTPIENTYFAITKICKNPDSVIALLDLDDALIGSDVVETIKEAYRNGADATVGSMLRTDKYAEYLVNFKNPRSARGGNVWQHLRTFRKYLFDQIKENDLKIDGEWIPHTEDWAFMLPIIELAQNPRHITTPLYFYEPSMRTYDVSDRESIIAKIVSKKSYMVN
jgi:2-polyprenyl-3-methyl-5-hydroxy-6-metoxy-1,4-benzoquinol methylase/GT2 family glycosyltransferase